MTDLEAYKQMLTKASIEFEEYSDTSHVYDPSLEEFVTKSYTVISTGDSKKLNIGYDGFYALHAFDQATGELIATGGIE